MDDNLEFTDDEIREELAKLGYKNVPDSRLAEFKKDLGRLIRHERSKQSSQNTSQSSLVTDRGAKIVEPRIKIPLEESPSEQLFTENKAERRLDFLLKTGKENSQFLQPSSFHQEVHHVPRRPDNKYSLHEENTNNHFMNDNVSETDSERRLMKRKVLRTENDGTKRIDESISESDSCSMTDINDRLRELGICDSVDFFDRRLKNARAEPPYRLAPDDSRPASVILRQPRHPHIKNIKKCDPVNRYQQFRESWDAQKAPGEKNHKDLRWNVRELMLEQEVVYEKKQQKVYVPNNYVIPSEKKRQTLRWQIRTDMAQQQLPYHGFFPEY